MIDPDSYDWSTFSITFYYNAHITRVFRAWTTAAGLESFFIERCVFNNEQGEGKDANQPPATGDHYLWKFRQDFEVEGTVTTIVEREQFSFSFGQMHVDVFFRVVGEQTEVQLVQSKIPNTPDGHVMGHLNCRSCWIFFMPNLSSVLDQTHDLRDQNPEIVSSMEVGYLPLSQR